MKKIVRVIPERRVVRYQCEHCKRKYKTGKQALTCEAKLVEQQQFDIGDRVTWTEQRKCILGRKYSLNGKVAVVTGPKLPDEEYNNKWLQGKLSKKHVFEYVVDWVCPHCHFHESGKFYGVELKKL